MTVGFQGSQAEQLFDDDLLDLPNLICLMDLILNCKVPYPCVITLNLQVMRRLFQAVTFG